MRSILFLIFFLYVGSTAAIGQTSDLHVRKAVLDGKGHLSIEIVHYDRSSVSGSVIDPASVHVRVDGLDVPVPPFLCTAQPTATDLSSVLTIDISGSMSRGGPNITLARSAAKAWVRALAKGSECAVTAFDNRASLVADFTTDTTQLLEAIESLKPRGGTDYDAGMLSEEIGGIPMASTGQFKRVLVFLTDGIGSGRSQQMIEDAIRSGVTIYCVSLGMSMPDALRRVSEETGGLWFENVTSVEQAEMAYRRIHSDATRPSTCFVDLDVASSCSKIRSIVVRVGQDSVRRTVITPDASLYDVHVSPLSLHFDKGLQSEQVLIRAGILPVTLTSVKITSLSPVRITLNSADLVFPITIAANDSAAFSVASDHTDSLYAVGRIQFEALPCPLPSIYTSAGKPFRRPVSRTIRVLYPNGGERIPAHSKLELRYDGVPSDLPVRVEVSFDLGQTWTLVADKATGHSVPWTAPPISSDSCLLRVSHVVPDEIRGQPVAVFRLVRIEQHEYTNDGKHVVLSGLDSPNSRTKIDSIVRVYDSSTGEVLKTFPGVRFLRVLSDGSLLTWGMNGLLRCYDVATGKETWAAQIAPSAQLISVTTDAQGSLALVLGGWDERPRVIDCATGLTVSRLPKNMKEIELGVLSSDGAQVALVCKDSSIQMFDSRTGRLLHRLATSPATRLYRAAFSPDGTRIVATSGNGTAVVWSTADGILLNTLAKRQYVNDNAYVSYLPDGKRIVLETGKDQTSIIDVGSGESIVTMQRTPGVGGVVSATLSRDGNFVALSSLGRVTVHETATGVMIYEMSQVEYSPSLSPESTRMLLRTAEGIAGVFEIIPAILQADTSDSRWAIYRTNAKLRNVRFSARQIGQSVDSTIIGGLVNGTVDTINVEKIWIEGADVKNFGVRTQPGAIIAPGDSIEIEYSFSPVKIGERAAMIVAEVTGGRLAARISGPARGNILSADADFLNCGVVDVGEARDVAADELINNTGKAPVRILSIRKVGPDNSSFDIMSDTSFTLQPGEKRDLLIRFHARVEGRVSTRLAFEIEGYPEILYATLYGRGAIDTFRVTMSDPTTFRGILLPTAVVPRAGTITTGVYDVLGLTAGYSITDNIMATAGGVLPLPNRWFGASGYDASWSAAWSLGAKAGFQISQDLLVGGGYQFGQSYYDQDISEQLESKITFNALWANAGWGNDDSRLNIYLGYAFKYHVTAYEGSYNADATIIGAGYDYRIGYNWKICSEVVFMRTMTFVPITITARYFDPVQAFEFGFTVTGIPASGATASAWPIIPMLSWVRRW